MNYGGCVVVHQEAFVCYTHADDQLDGGRIQQMAKDLAGEFAAISGDTLVVVVDRSYLHVGDDWRDRLAEAVGNATFLLPFVTPRFFLSDECRRELEHFVRTAESLQRGQLVVPILYIDVPDLHTDESDAARQLVASRQYVPWTALRFEDRASSAYRRAIHELAKELWDRVLSLPNPGPVLLTLDPEAEDDPSPTHHLNDVVGALDLINGATGPVHAMYESLGHLTSLMTDIGAVMQASTDDLVTTGPIKKRLAIRTRVANQLARDLTPIAAAYDAETNVFRNAVEEVDVALEPVFALSPTPGDRDGFLALAKSIIECADAFGEAFRRGDDFIAVLRKVTPYAQSLRPPATRIIRSLQTMRDSEPTMQVWADDARDLVDRATPKEPT